MRNAWKLVPVFAMTVGSSLAQANSDGLAKVTINSVDASAATITSIVSGVYTNAVNNQPDQYSTNWSRFRSTLDPISVEAPIPAEYAIDTLASFSGGLGGTHLSDTYINADGQVTAGTSLTVEMQLAGHSTLSISGVLSLQGFAEGLPLGVNPIYTSLGVHISLQSSWEIIGPSEGNLVTLTPLAGGERSSFNEAYPFDFAVTNPFDTTGRVTLTITTASGGGGISAVVPEPSTFGTMALGLAGLAVLARRRLRQRLPE